MPGLPRAPDTSRPRDTFAMMVLEPVERVTMALRRGDAFSDQALTDMEHLRNRLQAFDAALEARLRLVEDDE